MSAARVTIQIPFNYKINMNNVLFSTYFTFCTFAFLSTWNSQFNAFGFRHFCSELMVFFFVRWEIGVPIKITHSTMNMLNESAVAISLPLLLENLVVFVSFFAHFLFSMRFVYLLFYLLWLALNTKWFQFQWVPLFLIYIHCSGFIL